MSGQVTTWTHIWVRSRPGPTALYWVVDANGTTVSSGDSPSDYWTLVRVSACHVRALSPLPRVALLQSSLGVRQNDVGNVPGEYPCCGLCDEHVCV